MNESPTSKRALDRILIACCYFYLVIPILIFFFGWLKLPLAFIAGAVLLVGTYLTLRDFEYIKDSGFTTLDFVIISFLIVLVWVMFSGIGGFGYQNEDLHFKNAVFRDLINHRWPVIYDYSSDPVMGGKFGTTGALVYYFAYWLPSALLGKLFGWHVANLGLFVWTVAGAFLCVLLMARYIGRAKFAILLAFLFWSGLDYLGILVLRFHTLVSDAYVGNVFALRNFVGPYFSVALTSTNMGNFGDLRNLWLSYPGFTYEFFWSYNQVLPAWLATLLILNMRQKKFLVFTYLLLPLFAPIPAIGLLPFVVYKLLRQSRSLDWRQLPLRVLGGQWIRDRALLGTTPAVVVLAIVSLALFGSHDGIQPAGFVWELVPVTRALIFSLLLYYVLKVLAFGLFAFNKRENLGLILVSLGWLGVVPMYVLGISNDFGLKAGIPALIVLFTVGFKNIYRKFEQFGSTIRMRWTRIALAVVVAIGSMQSLHEFLRSRDAIVQYGGFPPMADAVGSLDYADARNVNGYAPAWGDWTDFPAYKMRYIGNFVAAAPENTWFFSVLARK